MAAKKKSSAKKTNRVKETGDVWLKAALALKPREVGQLSFNPIEAKRATRVGLAVIAKQKAALLKQFPAFRWDDVQALPTLTERVAAHQRQALQARIGVASSDPLNEGLAWRRKLLTLAQSLREAGKIDEKELKKVLGGSGAHDNVRDVLDLAAMLAPHASAVEATHGKGALEQATAAANQALTSLVPTTGNVEAGNEAANLRDRYARLVVYLHDHLRVGAAVLHGYREAAELVPPLNAGRSKKSAQASEPEAALVG